MNGATLLLVQMMRVLGIYCQTKLFLKLVNEMQTSVLSFVLKVAVLMADVNLICVYHLKAKQMPVITSNLRRLVGKSRLPYAERNLDIIVNIVRHSMQNATAFEEAAQRLKEEHAANVSNVFNSCHLLDFF